MTTLYHFTCSRHGAAGIQRDNGVIVPRVSPFVGYAVVWMTHDPNASRDALGLSSHHLSCDRMECRYTVTEPVDAVAWNRVRSRFRSAHILEAAAGTRPDLWWISPVPQRATVRD